MTEHQVMDCSSNTPDIPWKRLVYLLDPPATISNDAKSECRELMDILESLNYPVKKCLASWYRVKFKFYFKDNILGQIMALLKVQSGLEAFETVVQLLGNNVSQFLHTFQFIEEVDPSFQKQDIFNDLTTTLLNIDDIKHLLTETCVEFYQQGLDCFENITLQSENRNERLKRFDVINGSLSFLNLFDELGYDAVLHILNTRITDFITGNFSGSSLNSSIIGPVIAWLVTSVLPFIQFITQHSQSPPNLEMWKKRLEFFCYKTIATVRINDLFEIMVDYPDSQIAVMDIKTCLSEVQCSNYLIKTVQDMFRERLLHPGANTEDIITQYSSAIKVLRFLDPSGTILEKVCGPLRHYLKNREDTIRCILQSLLSEEDNELTRELTSTSGNLFNCNEDSDMETEGWETWKPESRDMPPDTKASKSADIITTLCSIYGSADVFVNEYRNLIAEKLLTTSSYDISLEMRSLELLRIGFGEDLSQSRIMLQDIVDSGRNHANIMTQAETKLPFDINVITISQVFWPNLRQEDITVYKPLQDFLQGEYTKLFSELKRNRTLEWKMNLGFVELDLEFENRTLSFTVSPIQATIISCFEESKKCHADTISTNVGLSLSQTRKKLAFWVTNGLLKETSKDMFELKDDVSSTRPVVVEEMDSAMVKIEQVREEELEGFTNFVMGLINQSGQITVERVHKLLSMLLSDSVAGQLTEEEVKTFLDKKVKQKLLCYSGGVYKKFNK